ncbi:hypothetical protein K1719_041303 [Acacia pycnantha]|nr:hypothetical protein K1719_041303 [Acacia pycnantha]
MAQSPYEEHRFGQDMHGSRSQQARIKRQALRRQVRGIKLVLRKLLNEAGEVVAPEIVGKEITSVVL